jgi:methyl-accepting chemotaxis protein
MKKLGELTFRARLTLAFGVLAALVLVLAAFSLYRMDSIAHAVHEQNRVQNAELQPLYAAREALAQTGLAARNAYIFKSEQAALRELDLLDKYKDAYLKALQDMEPALRSQPGFDKVQSGLLSMAGALKRPRQLRAAGDMEEFGRFLVEDCSPLRRQIVEDMGVVIAAAEARVAQASTTATEVYDHAFNWVLAQAVFTLACSIVIGVALTRSLLRQLGGDPAYAVDIAGRIAQGELSVAVDLDAQDKSSLLHALGEMRANLAGIVGQVREGSDGVAQATAEIAAGNADLSHRTEQQASSLEEVAMTMEELTASARQNAEHARQGNELVLTAASVSAEGGQAMADVVQTMDGIKRSSAQIAAIIEVIDGIAFQTNILALNAAVEAARAGEQGRGFAVVASEVRALAQRSAGAAKDIKALIDESVSQVDGGEELVRRAGEKMEQVVGSVERVKEIMQAVSHASAEQSAGIVQVNAAIADIDGLTQQNTALVEEATAAAGQLQQQAATLAQLVGVFRIDAQAQAHAERLGAHATPHARTTPGAGGSAGLQLIASR